MKKAKNEASSVTVKKSYRTRPGRGNASNLESQVRWYEQSPEDVHEFVLARVKYIRNVQVRRRFDLCTYQSLYCNTGGAFLSALFRPQNTAPYQRLSINVIKSCVDTACARISKDKPRVFVLPSSSDQSLIKRAENLTKFLDGAFVAGRVYENFEGMFRDAVIFDGGATWFRESGGEIVSELLKVDELVIDEVNGMRNEPTECFIDRAVPRAELLAAYPECEKEINEAVQSWKGDSIWLTKNDLVPVVYAFHSRSAEGSKDGFCAVCIPGKTLELSERDKDYLPIVRFHWTEPTYGPFGQGIAQELEGMQAAISSIARNIVRSIHMFAVPRVWVEKFSSVSRNTLNNDPSGGVNMYTGSKPVFETPAAASPDVYQFLQWLIDYCFKQLGLSQLTAQSEKPAGLNSGVGLRNYQDIETQRFAIVGQRWERAHLQAGHIVVDMATDLYKDAKSISVNVPGRSFIETLEWKDVSMKRDQYEMQAFPTSLLPRTPEGQLQSVQELISSGLMPPDVALSQLKIPNLNSWIEEKTASRDNTNYLISRIRDKKNYKSPNGIADIDGCVTMAMSAWLRADADDTGDPEVAELLLRFLNEAIVIQQTKNTPPPPPPGAAPPGASPVVGQAQAPSTAPLAPAGAGPIMAAAA